LDGWSFSNNERKSNAIHTHTFIFFDVIFKIIIRLKFNLIIIII
jgi:hypothetical protein